MAINSKHLLKKYNLKSKKYFSQHFLISKNIVEKMASFSKGNVLEIGAGLGALTNEISKYAKKVIAIEKDPQLFKVLKKEYNWNNVEVICADALKIEFPSFDVCISSVPYTISSPLLFKLLKLDFEYTILLLQKEFAQKLTALDNPSRLTIMTNSYADIERIMDVNRDAFYPRPRVDSCIVKIVPNKKFEIDSFYKKVVNGIFCHKRKTVKNALIDSREIFNKEKEKIKLIAQDVPFSDLRVKELDIYKTKDISEAMKKLILKK
ncbi:MAG: 16S rRNA (adenine(1518)-N(6)/adenine(1519)-N(6))-dimethyltransferase RsmA [Candidatus Methanofastidiosia archaeon]